MKHTISAGGSGYTASGTFHNIKLFDEGTTNWRGARASVTTNGSGTVTSVTITEGGSGYNTLDRKFLILIDSLLVEILQLKQR